jgi:hypothetical protein
LQLFDISAAEQFLDRPNIAAILKQVHGKGMPKGMAIDAFYQPGSGNRFFYGPLKQSFMNMMSPFLSGLDILPTIFLRKNPLPPLWVRCAGKFTL